MKKIEQIFDDMDKELSLIECIYNSKSLMETYDITQEFSILWNIYNKLKTTIKENYE